MGDARSGATRLLAILGLAAVAIPAGQFLGAHDPQRWLGLAGAGFGLVGIGLLIWAGIMNVGQGGPPDSKMPEPAIMLMIYGFAWGAGSMAILLAAIGAGAAGFVLLVAAAAWVVVWMPERMRTTVAEASVVIERDVAAVFDFVSDARNDVMWAPGTNSVQKTTPGPIGAGTKFALQGQLHGRTISIVEEIVDFQANRSVTTRTAPASGPIVTSDVSVNTFEQVPSGTQVTHRFTGTLSYGNGLLGKALNRASVGRLISAVDAQASMKLKQVLESTTQPTT